MEKDIGFWNEQGEYIPDIQEVEEMEMDKEIIIDGIDVAGCGYFCEADKECSICGMGTDGEDTFCRYCKDNLNCYYKQLKRLEQENAEVKAENERLKEEIKVLQYNIAEYSNNNIDTAVTLFAKDKAKLEQENALLKAYKDKYYQQTLDDEIQINELHQTLQKIKAIAEQCMNKDACFECKYSDDCYIEDAEIPTYDICKLLIQKITKAEEE